MNYVLIGDDCSDCCYVANALTLLRLPYHKVGEEALEPHSLSKTIAAFVCPHLSQKSLAILHEISGDAKHAFIHWKDSIDIQAPSALFPLAMPFNEYELKTTLQKIFNWQDHQQDLNHPVFDKLIGQSAKMRAIKSLILQVAATDTTVLILGQSGTGKDIIASCIHQLSSRLSHPFVPINCGAIPSELIESELFGHEKGAFTGALSRRPGRFEIAKGGTLFMDEIGDMPLPMQVKLLRVIQERQMERVGGNVLIDIDVRLIAATHKQLEDMIEQGQFREDLFYRLNVFPIEVPSLHERKEDIPQIIDYQLNKIHVRANHRVTFTPDALETICEYGWPGNIRELQNFLERMVILYPDHIVDEKKIDLGSKVKMRKKRTKSNMHTEKSETV